MEWIEIKNFNEEDYYNFSDFNRVENNTEFLAEYLKTLGYSIPNMVFVTTRDNTYIDKISSINRLEDNINNIKFCNLPEWGQKQTWVNGKGLSYKDANRWENNLNIAKFYAENIPKAYVYTGQVSCGEEVIR